MTLAITRCIALQGLAGEVINVEVDISHGVPAYSLLGLPDSALQESRDRIRAALINSSRQWPNKKVTVSLSPAWLPKSGTGFDLPIAISILIGSGQISGKGFEDAIVIGELALDGSIKPIRGILPMVLAARRRGAKRVIIPLANRDEASLVPQMEILAFASINQLLHWASTGESPIFASQLIEVQESSSLDMVEVRGQRSAKFALEIAAIGGHHLMMVGPPGAGKTMLAERFTTILPPLSDDQAIEVTAIHSIAGALDGNCGLIRRPPFIAPHHSITAAAMIGGGSRVIKPGACSLAHNGVLFVDEAPECAQGVLDSLRQPLESGRASISRSVGTLEFPARFSLILAANPCPCGKFTGRGRNCECSSLQIRRYMGRLSGPLLDRIDIRMYVEPPSRLEMEDDAHGEPSSAIRERVVEARIRSRNRFAEESFELNSQLPAPLLRTRYRAEKKGMAFLHSLLDDETISARAFHKILRVAWSIADSRALVRPGLDEITTAYELRQMRGVHE